VRAVDGVDLAIKAGKTTALVGESGCGKTTVGRSILRLIDRRRARSSSMVRICLALGPRELRRARQDIQMVFQDPMTALDRACACATSSPGHALLRYWRK